MDLGNLLDKAKDVAGDVINDLKDDAQAVISEATEKVKEGGMNLENLKDAATDAFDKLKDKAVDAAKDSFNKK